MHILCLILNSSYFLLPDYYNKIPTFYDTWISTILFFHILENLNGRPNALERLAF